MPIALHFAKAYTWYLLRAKRNCVPIGSFAHCFKLSSYFLRQRKGNKNVYADMRIAHASKGVGGF